MLPHLCKRRGSIDLRSCFELQQTGGPTICLLLQGVTSSLSEWFSSEIIADWTRITGHSVCDKKVRKYHWLVFRRKGELNLSITYSTVVVNNYYVRLILCVKFRAIKSNKNTIPTIQTWACA